MTSFWDALPRPFTALAPMAGVTDTVFRRLCKEGGADVVYTEFLSIDAIVHESKKTFDMMRFDPSEQPVVVQIFGKHPELYEKAARIIARYGFAGIDINFGCPAYKVVKNGGGVSLMRNPSLCRDIVAATVAGAGNIPVSIKCRASIKKRAEKNEIDYARNDADGLNDCNASCETSDTVTAVDLINAVKDTGLSAVMLHARSYEKPFDGAPDINAYHEVRKIWDKILIANGGIDSPESAQEILSHAPVDGVGIARGSWGKPWIFKQIREYLHTGSYTTLTLNKIKERILHHAHLALALKGTHGLIELRKHLGWYIKGFPHASQVRTQLMQCTTVEEIEKIFKEWRVEIM